MGNELTKPAEVLRWAVILAWAALIFLLSTRTFSSDFTLGFLVGAFHLLHLHVSGRTLHLLHGLLRKLAHLTEYAIFALLLYGSPGDKSGGHWRPRRAVSCILIAALYSLTDEFHQIFVPGRHGSLLDCALDTFGAALAMLVPYTREKISLLKLKKTSSEVSRRVNPSVPPVSESES